MVHADARFPGHPLFVRLAGEAVVVVGGGAVAERKVAPLVEGGARVTVISPAVTPAIREWAARGLVRIVKRPYAPGDLRGVRLAYAATDDEQVNRAVRDEADTEKIWLNVADRPELCDFFVPAVVRQGDLSVAVSTGGASPALARRIREVLAERFGPEYAAALEQLRAIRDRCREEGRDLASERERIEAIVEALLPRRQPFGAREPQCGDSPDSMPMAEAFSARGEPAEPQTGRPGVGRVFLVGAGPGDPGLMTVKGQRALALADVVFYDALVDTSLLEHCRRGTRCVFVGKRQGCHTLPQDDISRALVDEARAGHVVVRLKGGDPFIFGRGGEEAQALAEAAVPYEVVPGVSAGIGAPAYAGIPLTHRAFTSELVFLTGHECTGDTGVVVDWARYAPGPATLVIFMGRDRLDEIARLLLDHGRDPECPAAVIFAGTTSRQRTLVAPLKDIAARAAAEASEDTALVVVGEVIRMREALRWFAEQESPQSSADEAAAGQPRGAATPGSKIRARNVQ